MRRIASSRFLRAALAFLALPGVVAFLVPLLIALGGEDRPPFSLLGVPLLVAGTALLAWCVRTFYVAGKVTLAPWDPPRHLVVIGPYRWSRNPMYIAVVFILLGWAIVFRSWGLLAYALVVKLAFHLRVVFGEERWLARTHHEGWKRYREKVPRWIFPSRTAAIAATVAFVLAVPLAGLIYEAYADAKGAREFPPPGMLVDVGGRRLHLVCLGEGEPTVIFEGSGFGNSMSASRARARVATRVRVCSYDRIGMGWSDPGPSSASPVDLARDLAVLQDRAKLRAPFVVVASSIGGLTAEMFAREYPERVAGLVFVDAASSEGLKDFRSSYVTPVKWIACAAGGAAAFGVIRLVDPFGLNGDSSEGARRSAAITYGSRPWATLCAIVRGVAANPGVFEQAPPLRGDVPMVVLSASSEAQMFPGYGMLPGEIRDQRVISHKKFAQRSSRGTWRQVPDSTHLIGDSQPDAVADAVFDVLEQVASR